MKKLLFLLLVAIIYTFSSCSEKKTEEKKTVIDTIPMMVMQIQKCNRLYTTEIHVHKIVTHDDQLKLKGSIFKKAHPSVIIRRQCMVRFTALPPNTVFLRQQAPYSLRPARYRTMFSRL